MLPMCSKTATLSFKKGAATSLKANALAGRYLKEVRLQPLLSPEEERALARLMRAEGGSAAARQLAASNLRFVVKIAAEYRGYGLPLLDLIQEGNTGLLLAVRRFDPERGNRLATYAIWWIRAFIHAYVMSNWSLVKIGTTEAQRRLFFKVRSERARLEFESGPAGGEVSAKQLAQSLSVKESEVESIENRMRHREAVLDDIELGTKSSMWSDDNEKQLADRRLEVEQNCVILRAALAHLRTDCNHMELCILDWRMMSDEPATLQAIADKFGLSRERVRQVEAALIVRLRRLFRLHESSAGLAASERVAFGHP